MLDRSREASSPSWMRLAAPLVAATLALIAAGWLTYAGFDEARDGCGCDEPLFSGVRWVGMIAVAVLLYAGALALIVRTALQWRSTGNRDRPATRT
jgi:hypothetical protein